MAYNVYILYSEKFRRFYVGCTPDLDRRVEEHNRGESTYTSGGMPWVLVWSCVKDTESEAERLEKKLKNLTKERKIKFMFKYHRGIYDVVCLAGVKRL